MNVQYITDQAIGNMMTNHPTAYSELLQSMLEEEYRQLSRELSYCCDDRRSRWIEDRLHGLRFYCPADLV